MTQKLINNMHQPIPPFINSLKINLPTIENEVNALIKTRSKNRSTIENRLEILLPLNMYGIAGDLFSRLLEYYKVMNLEDTPSSIHHLTMQPKFSVLHPKKVKSQFRQQTTKQN